MQRTDYRFTLTRDTDTFEVTPMGFFDGNFKYEQQEGQLFFRMKYEGNLIFKGNDYQYFKTRYDLNAYCDLYEILIEKYDGTNYVVFWSGYFSMTDCKFDFEKCQVIVTPVVYDKYSCLLRNSENGVNLIDNSFTILTGNLRSRLEIQYKFNSQTEITPIKSMTMWRDYDETGCGMETIRHYAREAIVTPKGLTLSLPWELDDDTGNSINEYGVDQTLNIATYDEETQSKWVRAWTYNYIAPALGDFVNVFINLQDFQTILDSCFPGNVTTDYYQFGSAVLFPTATSTSNLDTRVWFVKPAYHFDALTDVTVNYRSFNLIDSITKLLKATCTDFADKTVTSTFFTNSTNPATNAASESNNLYLIQNSDAKRPNASNPATKGLLNFKDLMADLYIYFQVWWYLDDDNNLVIKHQSEIENIPGINITLSPYIKTTAHKKYIEFNKSLIYRYEKWDLNNTDTIDFVGLPIEYDELCSGKEDPRTKTYNGQITTDLGHIQQHQDDVSDEGFTLVAAPGGVIQNRVGLISARLQANEWLSISRLHNNYWRHNRILRTGKLNGVDTTFISSQKIRKMQEQNIILCESFDPLKSVTTELGSAIVNEATYFPLDSKLTLNLSI